jgi:hypothetical protein
MTQQAALAVALYLLCRKNMIKLQNKQEIARKQNKIHYEF